MHPNVLTDEASITRLLLETKRIAVLGIKTEEASGQAAYYVPEYLSKAGFEVIPVPVYYPDATTILGQPVFRSVSSVKPAVDMVDVFRRPKDLSAHLDDILAAKPKSVWLQQGIRDDAFADHLAKAGIQVVQDRCLMVDVRSRPEVLARLMREKEKEI